MIHLRFILRHLNFEFLYILQQVKKDIIRQKYECRVINLSLIKGFQINLISALFSMIIHLSKF